MKERLAPSMKEVLFHSHEFVNDVAVFQRLTVSLVEEARRIVPSPQIGRVLFFKLTAHVTFRRFLQEEELLWKQSIIIGNILQTKRQAILASIESAKSDSVMRRKPYIERAIDLLGHIKTNSELSVIVYHVIEAVSIIQTLCIQCKDLTFDECLLLVIVSAQQKHLFPISHYLQRFILNRGKIVDLIFERDEISFCGMFASGMLLLLKCCKAFDKRVDERWVVAKELKTPASLKIRRHQSMIIK
jgi:hypothetical protein